MKVLKRIEKLVEENPYLDSDLEDAFYNLSFRAKVEKVMGMFRELKEHLPHELALRLCNTLGIPPEDYDL
jgi:hypothetical protein